MEFLHTKDQDKYITLKEASDLCNYSPDYIGQLIRAGKIEGKQVYSNVAWVTTEEALRNYIAGKGKEVPEDIRKISDSQMTEVMRYSMYAAIAVLLIFLLILAHIFSVSLDKRLSQNYIEEAELTAVSYE